MISIMNATTYPNIEFTCLDVMMVEKLFVISAYLTLEDQRALQAARKALKLEVLPKVVARLGHKEVLEKLMIQEQNLLEGVGWCNQKILYSIAIEAARGGNKEVIEWVLLQDSDFLHAEDQITKTSVAYSIALESSYIGNTEILEWLLLKDVTLHSIAFAVAQGAASNRKKEVLEWLVNQDANIFYVKGGNHPRLVAHDIVVEASCNGAKEILQWIVQEWEDLLKVEFFKGRSIGQEIAVRAARHGYLEVFQSVIRRLLGSSREYDYSQGGVIVYIMASGRDLKISWEEGESVKTLKEKVSGNKEVIVHVVLGERILTDSEILEGELLRVIQEEHENRIGITITKPSARALSSLVGGCFIVEKSSRKLEDDETFSIDEIESIISEQDDTIELTLFESCK